MIEFVLKQNAYELLNKGKTLKGGGEDFDIPKEPVGDIVSVISKSGEYIDIFTHIQTAWDGKVTKARRRKVLHPVYIGEVPLLLRSGTFLEGEIEYSFNIRETYAGAGDMVDHKSDVLCSALKGRFVAANQDELLQRIREYSKVVNQVYSHLYDPRNTEKLVGSGQGLSKSQLQIANNPKDIGIETSPKVLKFEECGDSGFEYADLESIHDPKQKSAIELAEAIGFGQRGQKENSKESTLIKVRWSEIGGFLEQKKQVKRFINDVLDPQSVKYSGRNPAELGGMIFLGPTGWGKTYFANACTTEVIERHEEKTHYFYITYGELASMWRGNEAKGLAKRFAQIKDLIEKGDYVVWFFEELQAPGERDESPQKSNELLNELLAQMGTLDYTRCFMMAATARDPANLDPQLLRPGRFGEHVFFRPPLSLEDATDILTKIVKKSCKIAKEAGNYRLIPSDGLDYKALGKELTDFSPVEIKHVVENTIRYRTDSYRDTKRWKTVNIELILEQIRILRTDKVRAKTNVDQL